MRTFLPALISLVLVLGAVPAWATDEAARSEILQSARLWEARHRDDLAAAAYEKLLLIEPTNTQTMLLLGLLKIREGKMDVVSQLVQRLRKIQPDSLAARQLSDAYRIGTRDRLKMATVRRLAQSQRPEQAIKALRELFPDGPPTAELGMEYYQLIAGSPAGWQEARNGLTRLAAEYSQDPRYRLALARLLLRREVTRVEGLKQLAALARDPDADQLEVADLRKNALQSRSHSSATDANSPVVHAERLLKESDAALAQGQQGPALKSLEQAVDLVPRDPWTRFSLAKLYVRLDLPDQARSLMQEGVNLSPRDDEMIYAQALLLSSLDDDEAALTALKKIPEQRRSDGMKALDQRAQIGLWRRQLQQFVKSGDNDAAERLLQSASERTGENPAWVSDVASSWMQLGKKQQAVDLMTRRLGPPEQAQGAALMAWAQLLNQQPDDARLALLLPRLATDPAVNAEDRLIVTRLRTSLLLRRVDGLRAIGWYEEALNLLDEALRDEPDNTRLLDARADTMAAQADVLADHGQGGDAALIFRKLLQTKPGNADLMLSYARSLRISGQRAEASEVLDELQSHVAATDLDTRLALIRQRVSLDQIAQARQRIRELLLRAPENPSVLLQAGRVERADGHYDLAADYFRRARMAEALLPTLAVGSRAPTAAEQAMAELEQRRDGFITSGINPRDKPGDAGVSRFKQLEIPVELVLPLGYEAHLFAHLDTVRLDAGTLPAVYNDAALYGKVQAFGPASLANFPNGASQTATGAAIGVGYETDHLRLDIGTTPMGFPVTDLVGGIKYGNSWGDTDYSIDLSRRPITSSLLSYAGARDPVTGEVWGGVRSTGLDTRIARDFGRLGTSFSTGFHRLSGRNVLDNNFLSARAATDWLFINRADTRLTVGLALTHWRFRENLSGYTFGQGGYYSPQTYTSLSLPVDWRGRWGRWSYRLRPGVSYSHSTTKESPFYPTRNDLQTMALGSPLPPSYTRPFYDGGSSSGIGYSLKAALEYQILPEYFLGGSYDLDRSDYYAPNSLLLYFRHVFRDWMDPVPYPPRPPKSYADF